MIATYKKHIYQNLKLALPVTLANAGHMMTSMADTIMVGQIGVTELAAVGFSNSIFMFPFLIGVGMATGITAVAGRANGEEDHEKLSSIYFNGHWLMFFTGILTVLVLICASFFLNNMGQDPGVSALSFEYLLILTLSVIPYFTFLGFKQFWEGLHFTSPGMYIIIGANAINIVLNYLLIFGKYGFPEYGLNGAGWATLISRIIMLLAAFVLTFRSSRFKSYLDFHYFKINFKRVGEIFRIGLPIGLQVAFEVGAFSAGVIIAGFINEKAQAAHKIALDLAAFTFMMAAGVGSAATISISNYLGSKNYEALKRSGRSVAIIAFVFMAITCMIFLLTNEFLPTLYTNDMVVISTASSLLIVAAFFQISDGLQVTMIGALRGLHDVKVPTILTLIAYWVIAIPLSYLLAVELSFGAVGIWYGYLTGLTIVAVGLIIRFEKLVKKKKVENADW